MKRATLSLALLGAIAAHAPAAGAVNLSPNGIGQVLIYPYYTVNANQQTLISVVNTTNVGKAVKVRFREAYNGRSVLDFNLYLSPEDVWTAMAFALSDAGISGGGAGVFTSDNSCVVPTFSSGLLNNGYHYQQFSNANYTGASADSGPSDDARTREGHIELIQMSDIVPGSPLYVATKHVNSVPPGCATLNHVDLAGYGPPTADPATGNPGTLADGGLFGTASVVNVADGIFFAYTADALDGFSYVSLHTPPGDAQPTLVSVNDRDNPDAATARVFAGGETIAAAYPSTAPGSRKIDAVSAVFAANSLQNEYVASTNGSAGTDWVLTLPTKYAYVDAKPGGAIAGAAAAFPPFEALFGSGDAGMSCLVRPTRVLPTMFDREENTPTPGGCGFMCPPPPDTLRYLCLETNVIAIGFAFQPSVLASQLNAPESVIKPIGVAGWINWDLSQSALTLNPAANGDVFRGIPVTGFAAVKYVNGVLHTPDGGNAIANYSGTYHHHSITACVKDGAPCQ